ncbi:hypothetical protein EVAR_54661_1 [Eumeta japonica]|uniref:Uncharacterized protein n=1 Tax=Eumeta variegata TaxID=151549 RepID=A0A4C1X5Z9_EUMVA|nr:hypothetical protein EVAR_54661_1 [Eumeta japonica]
MRLKNSVWVCLDFDRNVKGDGMTNHDSLKIGKNNRHNSVPFETAFLNGDVAGSRERVGTERGTRGSEGRARGMRRAASVAAAPRRRLRIKLSAAVRASAHRAPVYRWLVAGEPDALEGPRTPRDRPPWRCYGPMLTHSRSDGDFPIYTRVQDRYLSRMCEANDWASARHVCGWPPRPPPAPSAAQYLRAAVLRNSDVREQCGLKEDVVTRIGKERTCRGKTGKGLAVHLACLGEHVKPTVPAVVTASTTTARRPPTRAERRGGPSDSRPSICNK